MKLFRAHNITERFPDYTVSFIGIGSPPAEAEDRGHCSQMALFVRQDQDGDLACTTAQSHRNVKSVYTVDNTKGVESLIDSCGDCIKEQNFGICTYYSYSRQTAQFESDNCSYKLIQHIEYPYEDRDPEEIIMHDILYKLSVLGRCNGIYYAYDSDRAEIPLSQLTQWHSDGPFITESEIR